MLRLSMSAFSGWVRASAPARSLMSVIACVGPDDRTVEERVGYYGEKVVLYAQQLGLNTCWAGTYGAKNVPAEIGQNDVVFVRVEGENL